MANAEPISPPEYFAHLCGTVAVRVELKLDEHTPLEVAEAIVAGLPKGWSLRFYDRDYPSKSDPGGYVTVTRRGRRYRLRRANHGWTSQWVEITSEEATAYLHRCRCHQDSFRPYDNLVALVLEQSARSRRTKR